MSSAALQTTPHQQHTALTATSGRQYRASHSSPSSQGYNAQQTSTASPSSRRPPSRKISDSAPSPAYHLAPGFGNASPAAPTSTDQQSPDRHANMPPVAPPRTSSSHQSGSSRRANYTNDKVSNSPRRTQADGSRTGSCGDSVNAVDASHRPNKAEIAARVSSRDGKNSTTIPIRSAQSTPSKPFPKVTDGLTRVIAAAQEPNGRDRNHAQPQQDVDDAAPPPVVASGEQHEERRGQRSRHDHSRSHKGTTKFGDFILGNTIGEGEFGKVKLGWKQDSSVQVCNYRHL